MTILSPSYYESYCGMYLPPYFFLPQHIIFFKKYCVVVCFFFESQHIIFFKKYCVVRHVRNTIFFEKIVVFFETQHVIFLKNIVLWQVCHNTLFFQKNFVLCAMSATRYF